MIGFGDGIALFYKNYVNFEGRAGRAEYWWPTLMQVIVYALLLVIFAILLSFEEAISSSVSEGAALGLVIAAAIFWLINFLPGIAVKVRRFHDLDQSGWLVLLFWAANLFVPLAELARMIWFAVRGTEGPNKYGPDPYGYDADIFG